MSEMYGMARQEPSLFLVISGPSGVGKDAVLQQLNEQGCCFHFVVTATSRPKRANEVDGVDYIFVSPAEFEAMIARDELLEYANVYGQYKGIPRRQVDEALASGKDVFVRVDVQGAETVREKMPAAISIFLSAASEEELNDRLRKRDSESGDDLAERIAKAREEMERMLEFDYLVVNRCDRLDEAVTKIMAIMQAEKCRVARRRRPGPA